MEVMVNEAWENRALSDVRVSYVMTTLNKLPYLMETIPRILDKLGSNEEFIVVDGNSQDGSHEYLAEFAHSNKIHWYLSEPDYCEAHALNKAILAARGKYITVLTDDDVFCFSVLRDLHRYLDSHLDVSVVIPSGADTQWKSEPYVSVGSNTDILQQRYLIEDKKRLFTFSGLGLTLRRSALPEIGLFDLNFKRVDLALASRLTVSPVKIAACSLYGYVRVLNSQSQTMTMGARNFDEKRRLTDFYSGGGVLSGRDLLRELADRVKEKILSINRKEAEWAEEVLDQAVSALTPSQQICVAEIWLANANANRSKQYIKRG